MTNIASDASFALEVEGLSKLEIIELEKKVLPGAGVQMRALDQSEHRYNEPGTILAIIALGGMALQPLLVWLVNGRNSVEVHECTETQMADGSRVKRTYRLKVRRSTPPDPTVLEKLGQLPGTDPAAIARILGIGTLPNGGSGDDPAKVDG